MNVLVTGASGFIGRAVVSSFLERGHGVRAMVRGTADVDGLWDEGVDVVRADLRVTNDLAEATSGVDAVVHLAAGTRGGEAEQFASSVVGTERLLVAMAKSGVTRLVLGSSFTVYDWEAADGELTERTPLTVDLEARGSYTVAKVWQERVARRASHDGSVALTVLRPGVVWGVGNEYPPGITGRVGSAHLVFGRHARLPLTHVDNCADCFATVAEDGRTAGETYNVVDGPGVPTWDFVGELLRRTGTPGRRVLVPYGAARLVAHGLGIVNERRFGGEARLPSMLDEPRFVARFKPLRYSNEKLRSLGWRPPVLYEEAIERTFGPRPRQ